MIALTWRTCKHPSWRWATQTCEPFYCNKNRHFSAECIKRIPCNGWAQDFCTAGRVFCVSAFFDRFNKSTSFKSMRSSKLRDVQQTKNFSLSFFLLYPCWWSLLDIQFMCAPTQTIKIVAARAKKRNKKMQKEPTNFATNVWLLLDSWPPFFSQILFNLFPSLIHPLVWKRMCKRICNFSQWPYYDDWPKKLAQPKEKKILTKSVHGFLVQIFRVSCWKYPTLVQQCFVRCLAFFLKYFNSLFY